MAATVRISYFGASGTEPAGANAEGGINFNLADSLTGTTPIQIPTATGTNFSWIKNLALEVTGTAATAITNRQVYLGGTPTSGLKVHFKQDATYNQAASGNRPSASGSNGATPSGYTALSTTPQTYHSGSVSAGSTGRNGDFCVVVCGVDNTYSAGGGSAALPDLKINYDEA